MRTPPRCRGDRLGRRAHHVPVELGQRRTQPAELVHRAGRPARAAGSPGRPSSADARPAPRPRSAARRSRRRAPTDGPGQPRRRGGPSTTQRRWSVRRSSSIPRTHHRPALDDADAVAQRLDQLELVRREQHRHARRGLAPAAPRSSRRPRPGRGRRTARRAPGSRGVDQRRGQLHPLLVAQRQLEDLVAATLRDAQHLGPVLHRVLGRPGSARAAAPGRPAGRPPSCAGTGRAPRACTRCAAARRGRPAVRPSAPRRSASSTPSTIRMVVDLPAPFEPTKPTISPARP